MSVAGTICYVIAGVSYVLGTLYQLPPLQLVGLSIAAVVGVIIYVEHLVSK